MVTLGLAIYFLALVGGYACVVGSLTTRVFAPWLTKQIGKWTIFGSLLFVVVPVADVFFKDYMTMDQRLALMLLAVIGLAALLIPTFFNHT